MLPEKCLVKRARVPINDSHGYINTYSDKGVPTEARNSNETCFQVQCFVPDGKINFKLFRLKFVLLFSFDMIIIIICIVYSI